MVEAIDASVVFITGSSRGIGTEKAVTFAKDALSAGAPDVF